jgi:hypothetical protein
MEPETGDVLLSTPQAAEYLSISEPSMPGELQELVRPIQQMRHDVSTPGSAALAGYDWHLAEAELADHKLSPGEKVASAVEIETVETQWGVAYGRDVTPFESEEAALQHQAVHGGGLAARTTYTCRWA